MCFPGFMYSFTPVCDLRMSTWTISKWFKFLSALPLPLPSCITGADTPAGTTKSTVKAAYDACTALLGRK